MKKILIGLSCTQIDPNRELPLKKHSANGLFAAHARERGVFHFSPVCNYTPGFLDGYGYSEGKSETPQIVREQLKTPL